MVREKHYGESVLVHQKGATGAYKDIDVVMENQKDLAEVVVELTPLAVLKG